MRSRHRLNRRERMDPTTQTVTVLTVMMMLVIVVGFVIAAKTS